MSAEPADPTALPVFEMGALSAVEFDARLAAAGDALGWHGIGQVEVAGAAARDKVRAVEADAGAGPAPPIEKN